VRKSEKSERKTDGDRIKKSGKVGVINDTFSVRRSLMKRGTHSWVGFSGTDVILGQIKEPLQTANQSRGKKKERSGLKRVAQRAKGGSLGSRRKTGAQ